RPAAPGHRARAGRSGLALHPAPQHRHEPLTMAHAPGIGPEEREARIAGLRARRRARMRTRALRSALGTATLAVLLVAAGWWLLSTLGGRDFLLAQVVARLPAGTTLEWRDAEGPASGPLTLHDVRFQQLVCPEVDDQP